MQYKKVSVIFRFILTKENAMHICPRHFCMLLILSCGFILYAQTEQQDLKWKRYPSTVPVTAITVNNTDLWYSTSGNLRLVNINRDEIKQEIDDVAGVPVSQITCMATDSSGKILFGTQSKGIITFTGSAFSQYAHNETLSESHITVLHVDRKKRTWIGTDMGLHMVKNGDIVSYTNEAHRAARKINDIDDDTKGRVWFATDDGVLCLVEGNWEMYTEQSGLSYNTIHALAYDDVHEQLWVAAGEADINMYNDSAWNVYMDITQGINDILTDSQGRIWFGGTQGLIKYNTIEWVTDPEKIGFSVAQINAMQIDPGGNMYFASGRGVIFLQNPYPY